MCVCVCSRMSDRDGPSEGTDGDNNTGKRQKGEMDGGRKGVEEEKGLV